MANLELIERLVTDCSAVITKRASAADIQAVANQWYRAFKHTDPHDLDRAHEMWMDHLNPDNPPVALPTSGAIQAHLTNLILARSETARRPVQPKPEIRPAFAVAQLAAREEIKGLGRKYPQQHPHTHPRALNGCRECDRLDLIQVEVKRILDALPAPATVEGCACLNSGWVTAKDGTGVYPCRKHNPEQFARWIGQELAPDSGPARGAKARRGRR